jgi:hypothetical protein
MANQMPFPEIPPGLLIRLEKAFPDEVPRSGDAADWHRAQGQQMVMDLLRKHYEKQQERIHVQS